MQSAHAHHHTMSHGATHHVAEHHHPMPEPPAATAPTAYVELEARPSEWTIAKGVTLSGWSYNGQVPGPVIEAHVGDLLVVRLTSHLPEPTTIHWHGLRIPAVMDGTEVVQHPVAPGETFEYRFTLPDAGTFWFHPHTNETVQLERGLHGVLIVRERGEDPLVVDRERVLVLDDVLLDGSGDFATFDERWQRHEGRDGNVLLLNGRADGELSMSAGQVERWRIVNVANSRYMRISLGGREFRLIGTDGGLIEGPVAMRELLLVPGDRAEILVGPFMGQETFDIEALPYARGTSGDGAGRVATVCVGPTGSSNVRVPATLGSIVPLAPFDAEPTRRVRFGGRRNAAGEVEFLVNGETHLDDQPVRVGELQVWEIMNATKLDHPFHLHGFFFQVLSENGGPPAFRSWEDTYNVRAGGRVTIAWMPDDRPGNWMYHCHILEHHAMGMMANFVVARPGQDLAEVQGEAMGSCHM
jgi:FtsP/CotA-like multicopper oxidase with cupredoxin domain